MREIVQGTYGPADVLELRDIDPPTIGDDEVLSGCTLPGSTVACGT